MSLSSFFRKLRAIAALKDKLQQEAPKLLPVLDALEADSHAEAWERFAALGDVAEVLDRLPPAAMPWLPIIGTAIMEAVDAAVDEQEIENFLAALGLIEPTPAGPTAGE